LKRILKSNFITKLTHWEYWPFEVVYFPFFFYWLWLSLKARSLFFFSASNPSISTGGMFGESKYEVLNLVPKEYKPNTVRIEPFISLEQLKGILRKNNFNYPLIFKPDVGERGYMVKRIFNDADALVYLQECKVKFLVQDLVELPVECGVFYTRFPDEEAGKVTSLVLKEMLTVTGNGKSTLQELIIDKPRAKLHYERLQHVFAKQLNDILEDGKQLELNSIGNHCLGTKFINGEDLITDRLSETFDAISKMIPGFYFGRFDLRCASIEDLYKGKIMVVELNGCGAEPAHIYAPGFPLWRGLCILRTHWSTLYTISMQNHKRGTAFISYAEGVKLFKQYRQALR
jgi:hypothetical protein